MGKKLNLAISSLEAQYFAQQPKVFLTPFIPFIEDIPGLPHEKVVHKSKK